MGFSSRMLGLSYLFSVVRPSVLLTIGILMSNELGLMHIGSPKMLPMAWDTTRSKLVHVPLSQASINGSIFHLTLFTSQGRYTWSVGRFNF